MIEVEVGENISINKLSIKLIEGLSWNLTFYDLFRNSKVINNNFPKNKGLYSLMITYSDEMLVYKELILYTMNPSNEKLKFNLYFESNRLFCKISSELIDDLNKEIVLYDVSSEFKNILDTLDDYKNS